VSEREGVVQRRLAEDKRWDRFHIVSVIGQRYELQNFHKIKLFADLGDHREVKSGYRYATPSSSLNHGCYIVYSAM
jgi:hypothetical protein